MVGFCQHAKLRFFEVVSCSLDLGGARAKIRSDHDVSAFFVSITKA